MNNLGYSVSEIEEIHNKAFWRGFLCGIISIFGILFIIAVGYLIWLGPQLPH